MSTPVLYIFSGLPGSGKSTLAKLLARHTSAFYLCIDTVEHGLKDLCNIDAEAQGYQMGYRLVRDNLQLGISAIADSCNPVRVTRDEWEITANSVDARFVNIEVICSSTIEHRARVDSRIHQTKNNKHPDWKQVNDRLYEPWHKNVITLDTAGKPVSLSFKQLVDALLLSPITPLWRDRLPYNPTDDYS